MYGKYLPLGWQKANSVISLNSPSSGQEYITKHAKYLDHFLLLAVQISTVVAWFSNRPPSARMEAVSADLARSDHHTEPPTA